MGDEGLPEKLSKSVLTHEHACTGCLLWPDCEQGSFSHLTREETEVQPVKSFAHDDLSSTRQSQDLNADLSTLKRKEKKETSFLPHRLLVSARPLCLASSRCYINICTEARRAVSSAQTAQHPVCSQRRAVGSSSSSGSPSSSIDSTAPCVLTVTGGWQPLLQWPAWSAVVAPGTGTTARPELWGPARGQASWECVRHHPLGAASVVFSCRKPADHTRRHVRLQRQCEGGLRIFRSWTDLIRCVFKTNGSASDTKGGLAEGGC